MQWSSAEPQLGVYDSSYLQSIAQAAAQLRSQGYAVALNTGIQNAPQWLLNMAGGRFVDQFGDTYTAQPLPNLIFGKSLRQYAQDYLNHVFQALGTDFALVRAGGGYWGELSYPYLLDSTGHVRSLYWAFDSNAAATDPVPGWRPGDASPNGQAASFLNWYLNSLVDYQNWQFTALRTAGYAGQVAMLYPSYGMRAGDFDKAVADNLNGTSSAEINGEVQRGYDMARQVNALTDRNAVVYGTWGENSSVVQYLASLAKAKGLPTMAENADQNVSMTTLTAALQNAKTVGLQAFYLIRASTLTCGCGSGATLDGVGQWYWANVG